MAMVAFFILVPIWSKGISVRRMFCWRLKRGILPVLSYMRVEFIIFLSSKELKSGILMFARKKSKKAPPTRPRLPTMSRIFSQRFGNKKYFFSFFISFSKYYHFVLYWTPEKGG